MDIKTTPHIPLGKGKLYYYHFTAEAETKDGVLIEWFVRASEMEDISPILPLLIRLIQNYYAKTYKQKKYSEVILREYHQIKKTDCDRLLKEGNAVMLM